MSISGLNTVHANMVMIVHVSMVVAVDVEDLFVNLQPWIDHFILELITQGKGLVIGSGHHVVAGIFIF